jgi:pyridoxal phosphate enzyme (YggS family)
MEQTVRNNIHEIRKRIMAAADRSGRQASEIRLMAVTKTIDDRRILEAIATGIEIIGENYVQEAKQKIERMGRTAEWHLIGHLQTNKAKYAAGLFDMIHSLDRLDTAEELNRRCMQNGRIMKVLIEVNVSGETTKRGIAPDAVLPLIAEIAALKNLSVQGLMTMAPWFDDPEEARPYFASLRRTRDLMRKEDIPGVRMEELSMGMSEDFETAIEEGATIVRIGRAIFGERPPH